MTILFVVKVLPRLVFLQNRSIESPHLLLLSRVVQLCLVGELPYLWQFYLRRTILITKSGPILNRVIGVEIGEGTILVEIILGNTDVLMPLINEFLVVQRIVLFLLQFIDCHFRFKLARVQT